MGQLDERGGCPAGRWPQHGRPKPTLAKFVERRRTTPADAHLLPRPLPGHPRSALPSTDHAAPRQPCETSVTGLEPPQSCRREDSPYIPRTRHGTALLAARTYCAGDARNVRLCMMPMTVLCGSSELTTSCGCEAESDCHYRGIVCALRQGAPKPAAALHGVSIGIRGRYASWSRRRVR